MLRGEGEGKVWAKTWARGVTLAKTGRAGQIPQTFVIRVKHPRPIFQWELASMEVGPASWTRQVGLLLNRHLALLGKLTSNSDLVAAKCRGSRSCIAHRPTLTAFL